MDTVKLKINGMEVEAPAGSTIIQAANLAGVKIPSLCYLKDLNEIGACRICMVEVKGAKGPEDDPGTDSLQPSDGMPDLP